MQAEEREHAGGWEEGAVLEALQAAYKDAGMFPPSPPPSLSHTHSPTLSHHAAGVLGLPVKFRI